MGWNVGIRIYYGNFVTSNYAYYCTAITAFNVYCISVTSTTQIVTSSKS